MSRRRSVASLIKYRNPSFMGGKCPCCRTRMRDFAHEFYPNMCVKCRESRVAAQFDGVRAPDPVPPLESMELIELRNDLMGYTAQSKENGIQAPTNHAEREMLLKAYHAMPDGSIAKARAAEMLGLAQPTVSVQNLNKPVLNDLTKKIMDIL